MLASLLSTICHALSNFEDSAADLIQRYIAVASSGAAPSAVSAPAPDAPPRHPGMAHQHGGSSSSGHQQHPAAAQQHLQSAAHLNFMQYLQFAPPEQQQIILQALMRQQQQQGGSSGNQ
ncbi:hypothetical protein ACTXT7_005527 [Hymenolepis weldensis]